MMLLAAGCTPSAPRPSEAPTDAPLEHDDRATGPDAPRENTDVDESAKPWTAAGAAAFASDPCRAMFPDAPSCERIECPAALQYWVGRADGMFTAALPDGTMAEVRRIEHFDRGCQRHVESGAVFVVGTVRHEPAWSLWPESTVVVGVRDAEGLFRFSADVRGVHEWRHRVGDRKDVHEQIWEVGPIRWPAWCEVIDREFCRVRVVVRDLDHGMAVADPQTGALDRRTVIVEAAFYDEDDDIVARLPMLEHPATFEGGLHRR